MGWVDALRGYKVGLDTAPLIYFTEKNSAYSLFLTPFFKALERGEFSVVTSVITLLEALVHPIKDGNVALAEKYRNFCLYTNNVEMYDVTPHIAEEAAMLRGAFKIRTPDSIHLATAMNAQATYFLTNDIVLSSLPKVKILVIDELKKQS